MQIHSLNVKVAEVVGVNKALLLQYIEFWVEKNRANNVGIYEGKAWVYHTAKGFAQIFPYETKHEMKTYIFHLVGVGTRVYSFLLSTWISRSLLSHRA